jgi:hypothetical protein
VNGIRGRNGQAVQHDETTTDRLWLLAQGEPDNELQEHLTSCPECQAELATLQALATYGTTTGGGMVTVPEDLLQSTQGLFRRIRPDLLSPARSVTDQVTGAVRRIVANLILDTGTAALAGVRSDDERQTRQLAFVSELGDLDLMVTSRDAFSDVSGQLGMDDIPPGLELRFSPVNQPTEVDVVSAPLGPSGRFETTLRRGEWLAWIQIGDAILEFPGVQV